MLGKSEATWLEKIYDAEISNMLPFQSKAAIFKRLQISGLVDRLTVRFGVATVEGWQLTHKGRIQYCEWASQKRLNDILLHEEKP